ncbi:hypothetical protein TWF703_005079 [Orbilia oligospora]|uniref:F-box domain-containing protein n=1 Tax=Orbilia oligospora TaxID=2813651 RepID=A0A7C8NL45_ORBOL|nr:hypothetical protein TWF703_005079 [Orbilia oligospora]
MAFFSIFERYRATRPPVAVDKPTIPLSIPHILRLPVETTLQMFSYLPTDIKTQTVLCKTCSVWKYIVAEDPPLKRNRYRYDGVGGGHEKTLRPGNELIPAGTHKHAVFSDGLSLIIYDYVIKRYLLDSEWGPLDVPFVDEPFFYPTIHIPRQVPMYDGRREIAPQRTSDYKSDRPNSVIFQIRVYENTRQKIGQNRWIDTNVQKNATIAEMMGILLEMVKEIVQKHERTLKGRAELNLKIVDALDTSMYGMLKNNYDPNQFNPSEWFIDVIVVHHRDISENYNDLSEPPPVVRFMYN